MPAPTTRLLTVALSDLVALRRNPQYLSEKQNAALKSSIERDGFLAPIVIRQRENRYEILSGNHRVIASREAGLAEIPCVLIEDCDDKRAARIAVNMNTVHGDPTAELLAPFLADMDDLTLGSIFMDADLTKAIIDFDVTLDERLSELNVPDSLDTNSNTNTIPNCVCKCGNRHVRASKAVKSSKPKAKNTDASKKS